jgi:thiolase-like protein
MATYVLGMAMSAPQPAVRDRRCEELAFDTVRQALARAGVKRGEIDAVTLSTSDEMDGRSISSMLMAAPSGSYLKDELRVTDSGLTGLVMGALRIGSGRFHLGLVVSWSQTSQIDVDDLTRMRAEPFALRPIGLNGRIADALQAGALAGKLGLAEADVAKRVVQRQKQALRNPRGLRRKAATAAGVTKSALLAWPLRSGHEAPASDGCVAFVLASGEWLAGHPGHRPLARLSAVASGIDSYALGAQRLGGLDLFERTLEDVLRRAGRAPDAAIDVLELEAQNAWQDIALEGQAGRRRRIGSVSPSGGAWAQNPLFCTGLVNAAEAALQVAGEAGEVQVPDARFAVAHGSHGFAQQGHSFAAFERIDAGEAIQ